MEVINKKHNIKIREVIYEKTLRGVPMFTFITEDSSTERARSRYTATVEFNSRHEARDLSKLTLPTWLDSPGGFTFEGLRPIQQKAQTFDIFGLTFKMSVK